MAVDVRPCASAEELRDALAPIWHFFGGGPTPESAERFAHVLPPDRALAARVDGEVVGGASAFPFELSVSAKANGSTIFRASTGRSTSPFAQ